jgi:hypothetical protein
VIHLAIWQNPTSTEIDKSGAILRPDVLYKFPHSGCGRSENGTRFTHLRVAIPHPNYPYDLFASAQRGFSASSRLLDLKIEPPRLKRKNISGRRGRR